MTEIQPTNVEVCFRDLLEWLKMGITLMPKPSKADWNLILWGLNVLATFYIGLTVHNYTKEAEKRQVCLKLWEHWQSEYMLKCRNSSWIYLKNNLDNVSKDKDSDGSATRKFVLMDIERLSPEQSQYIWSVYNFLEDLKKCLDNKLVPKKLAKELFEYDFKCWFEIFTHPNLDSGVNEKGEKEIKNLFESMKNSFKV